MKKAYILEITEVDGRVHTTLVWAVLFNKNLNKALFELNDGRIAMIKEQEN